MRYIVHLVLLAAFAALPFAVAQSPAIPMAGSQAKKPATPMATPTAAAQQPAPPAVEDDQTPTFRGSVQVVLVPTTVVDKHGETVNGLQPQDFVLYDNNKAQQIDRDVTILPLSFVIAIQRSSNVEKILPMIKKTGSVISDLLVGQDGEAAVVSFDHRVEVLQDFTRDLNKIDAALDKLKPGGMNNRVVDAVNQATFMLRHKKDRRKVILLISETLDRSSESRPREVATNLQMYNIEVYTLNISRIVTRLTERKEVPRPDPLPPGARPRVGVAPPDPTSQNQISGTQGYGGDAIPAFVEMFRGVKGLFVRNPAELFTDFTGGREYSFMTQGDLERAISRMGTEIRSQYVLSYVPNNKLEGGFHRIRVEVKRQGLKVATRPGYWMAGVPD
ncbi:MAG TPA: VWA domain-containing protein [Bryobacteraceae bacterium]|nr:VWA domain-containing protein [Bryobacteraceae bacterium]